MLDKALDMDTGRMRGAPARVILYAVRLALRVEGYVRFLLAHEEWRARGGADAPSGCGHEVLARGLGDAPGDGALADAAAMAAAAAALRAKLDGRVFPLLERWFARAMRGKALRDACVTLHPISAGSPLHLVLISAFSPPVALVGA